MRHNEECITKQFISMWFLDVIIKNLRRRTTRTLLTVAGLAIAVTATTTLWNIAWGYARAADNFYAERDVDIVVVRAGVANRLTSSLRADLSQQLRTLPEVDEVDASLTEMVSVGNAVLIGIPLRGLFPDGFTIARLSIADGRSLQPTDRGNVLVGNGLAAALNKKVGQSIDVEGKQFQIVGIIDAANPFDANCIIAPLADVQSLMERPGIVSEFQIRVAKSATDGDALKGVCRQIEALRDEHQQPLGLKAQPTHEFVRNATESKLGSATAIAITIIVIVLSVVSVLNTMLMSVLERTRELGILRAIGWRKRRVLRMVVGESVAISLMGGLFGTLLSWGLVRLLSGWPRTSLLVPTCVTLSALLPGLAVAMFAGILGALYPAVRAASIQPIESLRYE